MTAQTTTIWCCDYPACENTTLSTSVEGWKASTWTDEDAVHGCADHAALVHRTDIHTNPGNGWTSVSNARVNCHCGYSSECFYGAHSYAKAKVEAKAHAMEQITAVAATP